AGERTDDGDGKELDDHHQRDGRGRAGEIEQQREHGNRIEPVAQLRDRLADVEQSKVAIGAKDRQVRIQRTIIIVAAPWSRRSVSTRSSIASARAAWVTCTGRAIRGSDARSQSNWWRRTSRTIPAAGIVFFARRARRRRCRIPISP